MFVSFTTRWDSGFELTLFKDVPPCSTSFTAETEFTLELSGFCRHEEEISLDPSEFFSCHVSSAIKLASYKLVREVNQFIYICMENLHGHRF